MGPRTFGTTYTLFLTSGEAVLALRGKKRTNTPQHLKPASLSESNSAPEAMPFPRSIHSIKAGVAPPETATLENTTVSVLRMKLRNASPATKVTGVNEQGGTSNYFIGNDPMTLRSGAAVSRRMRR